ncbi:nucleotidyltransferase family protein [Methylocystis bryophila]|uniref:Mannose-1-phosphate guanylyltransferase n=1 Tax=Methylocystis bryophila TaxID=655015 RepID=A0A1W6N058_9HYPH|nr:nucleotidyltransferase family protein [Methylocystis bryophila]ARN83212.1 mannose-1-phosphate guanylyltransferase [Methylocystis bryophila]BDV39553.1 mannose-1-phosphate guanylyltransferase [Methylocystis bryophila]
MRALLLAAGLGTRLRPLTDNTPKCLVDVKGRPLLDYWFDALFAAGAERVLINTHHLAEKVRAHVAHSRFRDSVDLVHEEILLGTGGTILANRHWAGHKPLFVAHADNLTSFPMRDFLERHARRPSGVLLSMLAFRTDDPRSCGILEVNEAGLVQAFHEKVANPPGNLANAAVYMVEPEVMELMAGFGRESIDFSTEVIPLLMGRIQALDIARYHRDIGTPQALAKAQLDFPF